MYEYQTLTPWCHPDNDSFGEFKAHNECNEKFQEVGKDWDWLLPQDPYEWREMTGEDHA